MTVWRETSRGPGGVHGANVEIVRDGHCRASKYARCEVI